MKPELKYVNPPALCERCGAALHPALIGAGYATHPNCDPADKPWRWRRRRRT